MGIGPGAHGRRGGMATQRHRKPENWLAALARNGHGIVEETPIPLAEKGIEALLMGLRLKEGVDLRRIELLSDTCAEALLDRPALARLQDQGLLDLEGHRLRITSAGMLLLDAILAEIIA
jgi:coproporphyrinogen III oxidase-like Fe-S oxidoreductase